MERKKLLILSAVAFCLVGVGAGVYFAKFRGPKLAKNAIIIMIDTLRADHLGVYGYARDTTPAIDAFARENVRASTAISVAPWTPPAVTSILTGLSVAHHGHNPSIMTRTSIAQGQILPDSIELIPEMLKKDGFMTAASSSNPWISKEFNFDQGFDQFYYKDHATTKETMGGARHAIDVFAKNPDKRFFLYVHILDPHGPYEPPKGYQNMFTGSVAGTWPYPKDMQDQVNLYDDEIRSVDDQVGDFFSFLKKKNMYDDTAIVVVSDHGEQFRERGDLGHGKMLHIEEVHVAFMAKCNGKNEVINDAVSNMDVTPTVLDCLKVPTPPALDGISIFDTDAVKKRGGVFSSVERTFLQEAYTTADGMRLINTKGRVENLTPNWNVEGVYDLPADPLEQHPGYEPAQVSELQGYLTSTRAKLTPLTPLKREDSKAISNKSMKQLETLGYINN